MFSRSQASNGIGESGIWIGSGSKIKIRVAPDLSGGRRSRKEASSLAGADRRAVHLPLLISIAVIDCCPVEALTEGDGSFSMSLNWTGSTTSTAAADELSPPVVIMLVDRIEPGNW
jgi:hypothetical protein